jgi:hypothetical protein
MTIFLFLSLFCLKGLTRYDTALISAKGKGNFFPKLLSTEVPSEKTEILLKMIYHKKVYLKEGSQMYICIIVFSLITFVLHLSQRKTLYILSDLLIYPLRLYLVNEICFVTFNNNKCFYLQLIGLNVSTVVGIVLMPKLMEEC